MPSDKFKVILIILAASAVYLIGNGRTQLLDRDEPRYAQCSRQMLQSGDWVVPRLYDKIRAAKPPGIYWCQATMMSLLGDNAFAARMPSTLAAVLTLALLAFALWREVGPQHTIWTLFIFASSALTIVAAKICLTDSVLLLWTTLAMLCIYLLWRGRGGWPAVIALSVAIAFGGLIKGPFILGVLAGTIIMLWLLTLLDRWLERRQRRLKPDSPKWEFATGIVYPHRRMIAPGPPAKSVRGVVKSAVALLIIAALIAPWLWLVHLRAPDFLSASTKDAMEHMESGAEGHKGPPGYHLVVIWFTFLPWSLILPLAIGLAFKNRRVPEVRFALAVVLGNWVLAECLQTKLPHYMLPAFPALALLAADAVIRCLKGEQHDLDSTAMRVGAVFWAIAIMGLTTVPWWWLAYRFASFPWPSLLALSGSGIFLSAMVCVFFLERRPRAALVTMGSGALVLAMVFFAFYLPSSQPLRLPSRIAAVLREHHVVHPGEVMMLDYKEPSLAFYQGGTIREARHSLDVLKQLDAAPPWLVMTREIWDQATPEERSQLQIVGSPMRGLNYSEKGRVIEILIVRNKESGRGIFK
jgi:4-amino-4-deoxy-L-arabinose transferase-like glycosyltransferase